MACYTSCSLSLAESTINGVEGGLGVIRLQERTVPELPCLKFQFTQRFCCEVWIVFGPQTMCTRHFRMLDPLSRTLCEVQKLQA
eukprot:2469192-Amphidinium_carterae.1